MLLSSSAVVPTGEGWLYELKWDGFRGRASIRAGVLDVRSRHGTDMRPWFPALDALARRLARDVVLDGEVVTLDAHGRPDFWRLRASGAVPTFVAFDVLAVDGRDVRRLPLRDRHALLAEIVVDAPPLIIRSRPFADGVALLEQAERLGLEGIVAKRAASPYVAGRSRDWVKIKTSHGRAEAERRLEMTWR
jgi:bifunctional non-homologous end joining protein LigD